jgi:hydroxypyruvate isomerase
VAAAALALTKRAAAQETTGSAAPAAPSSASSEKPRGGAFNLLYAPHFGLFDKHAGKDLIDQLKFMADEGFRALEDNGLPKRDVAMQEKIGQELERLNMQMGVFVAHGDFGAQSFTCERHGKRGGDRQTGERQMVHCGAGRR